MQTGNSDDYETTPYAYVAHRHFTRLTTHILFWHNRHRYCTAETVSYHRDQRLAKHSRGSENIPTLHPLYLEDIELTFFLLLTSMDTELASTVSYQ